MGKNGLSIAPDEAAMRKEFEADRDAARKGAKPLVNGLISPEDRMVYFKGQGKLDIAPVYIAVPEAYLLQLCGAMLSNHIAQMVASVSVVPVQGGKA